MVSVANDHAAEFEAAQAVCDRLLAEEAVTAAKLEAVLPNGTIKQPLRLRRRQADLPEQLVAAQVLAKQCYIASLEADLAQPREDYDEAVQTCARAKAEYDEARARFERSRERLLRASSHLNKLERVHDEHSQALKALLAEAHSSALDGSPILESPEGIRTASGARDAP